MSPSSGLPVPPVPQKPVTVAIIGAGCRGLGYAKFAIFFPEWMKVVAVADPLHFRCKQLAREHGIPAKNIFSDWKQLAKKKKLADAVAICTQDQAHTEPAIAFADLKYHILLEKPMSIKVDECVQIYEAVVRNKVLLAVGHVLRYTTYNAVMKRIVESKVLGDIVNIQHLEPVGFWHFAHSYVRGNWHNEGQSSFSLLTKSCHDIDILAWLMNSKCKRVSSFGNVRHFNKTSKPKEAGDATNCLDCPYESECAYSAKKIYLGPLKQNNYKGWPTSVVQPEGTIDIETLTHALRTKDYGKCVYEMDNDVCDHQVVNMEFENGSSVSFSMIAFTQALCVRKTRIFGTLGQLEGDGMDELKIYDFLSKTSKTVRPSCEPENCHGLPMSGHGGGDFGLMQSFMYACVTGKQEYILSGPQETLDSHIYCFAAEHARKTKTVVDIEDFKKKLPFMASPSPIEKSENQKRKSNFFSKLKLF